MPISIIIIMERLNGGVMGEWGGGEEPDCIGYIESSSLFLICGFLVF
jgi:hypothetical protein